MRRAIAVVSATLTVACTQRIEVGSLIDANQGNGAAPYPELEPFTTPVAAAGTSTCALTSNGGVACWGSNDSNQLGLGGNDIPSSASPLTPVGLDTGAQAVFGGGSSQCALVANGRIVCWGGALYGILDGVMFQGFLEAPHDLEFAGEPVVQYVSGSWWHCLLSETGAAKCAGYGAGGNLGTGRSADTYPFENVAGEQRFRQLAASTHGGHMCGVSLEGSVYCWGQNGANQLGQPGPDQSVPTLVAGLEGAVGVAVGLNHSCMVNEQGGVWCWGANHLGQAGSMQATTAPALVPGLPPMTAIAAGDNMSCGLAQSAGVLCWGDIDAAETASPPVEVVEAGFGAIAVSCGGAHACSSNAARQVRCWGNNDAGQTGGGQLSL